MKYAAVIAAAGLSSRMHELKPLMKLGSSTMIDNVIDNLKEAGAEQIAVVTGYKSDHIRKHLEESGTIICENSEYASTKMMDSVKIGLHGLGDPGNYDYVFITPVDVPLVNKDTLERMKKEAEKGCAVIRPSYSNKAGHPLMIRACEAQKLRHYEGEDGIRGFLREYAGNTSYVNVKDPGILMDADTREDYRKLRKLEIERKTGGRLWYEMELKISRSEAILTQESVQFLEMIDQTGSLQGACACMHMSYSKGWTRLKKMEKETGYPLTIRTSGGEGGGGTTLSDKGRKMIAAYNRFTREMQEEADLLFDKYFREEFDTID